MPAKIEDYAMIGDCHAAALVSRFGSIDWLCWPRFDSDACFAALLGSPTNGRWLIAPTDPSAEVKRSYRADTLVLETTFECRTGAVMIVDFMPPRREAPHLVRIVRGLKGEVDMHMELVLRFGLGAFVPWVTRQADGAIRAVAGPDMTVLRTSVDVQGSDLTSVAHFRVGAGGEAPFLLSYGPSSDASPPDLDVDAALRETTSFWTGWSSQSAVSGPYADVMKRSLVTLKALTFAPTGGLVAAPTTSLPEALGGVRNWDYRYCWIRDATMTLIALMNAGHFDEARAWIGWLHRAVAGTPDEMQVMYGVRGERRLREWEAEWLAGYEGARPVRIGNAAHAQLQLDVFGELVDAFRKARNAGLLDEDTWPLEAAIVGHVEQIWRRPDHGIWEARGTPRHFTFSKVMAWVVMDRAVRAIEEYGFEGPVDRWRDVREEIRAEVFRCGCNGAEGAFRRAYDDAGLDASLLLIADVGFVEHDDPRFVATVAAIERQLVVGDGLVMRYDTANAHETLPPGEGAFLPCSCWLANALLMLGRRTEAERLFHRVLALCNDVGLLAEEFDPGSGRMCGNFPQAFSHLALLGTASNLSQPQKPSVQRKH